MESNSLYKLRARAYNDNINLYAHSDFSIPVEYYFSGTGNINTDNNNNMQYVATNNSSSNNYPNEFKYIWTHKTEEEKIRYACFGKEKVEFMTPDNQPSNINIQNAMQGEKCFEVFQIVAGDYIIARTYNIYPLGSETNCTTNDKVTISLTVPEIL